LQIEYIDQSELHLNDENVNIHSTKSIEKIAKSIEAFGFKNPIIIDQNNIVIAGNGRLEAARSLMIDKIPCIRADDLTPEQLKAFAIADNRVADESFFDKDLLDQVIIDLKSEDFDIGVLGFDDDEILDIENIEDVELDLPSGDKTPITNMTFTVSSEQHDIVTKSLSLAKTFPLQDPQGVNDNSNGNALYYICEFFINRVGEK